MSIRPGGRGSWWQVLPLSLAPQVHFNIIDPGPAPGPRQLSRASHILSTSSRTDNSLSDMNNLEFEVNYVNAMPRVGLLGTWKIISLVT